MQFYGRCWVASVVSTLCGPTEGSPPGPAGPGTLQAGTLASLDFVSECLRMPVCEYGSEPKVAQLCPTLCDPVDYTVHGILQARILEWVAFPFSRGSSKPRDQTQVSCIAGGFFTSWATREGLEYGNYDPKSLTLQLSQKIHVNIL